MRTLAIKRLQIYCITVMALLTCFFAENSFATTHVVMFGGALGFVYSPSSFSAKVGDTVRWEGDFSIHPLSSTTIPANAASWHSATGSVFTYVITVAGTYNFHCDVHFSIGMTGSFTATSSTVNDAQIFPQQEHFSMTTSLLQGKNMANFTIPNNANVMIKLFDMRGREISTVLHQFLPAGSHEVIFGPIPIGLYCLKLYAGKSTLVRTIY